MLRVLEEPGLPTSITGILLRMETTKTKMFSESALLIGTAKGQHMCKGQYEQLNCVSYASPQAAYIYIH